MPFPEGILSASQMVRLRINWPNGAKWTFMNTEQSALVTFCLNTEPYAKSTHEIFDNRNTSQIFGIFIFATKY